MNNYVLKGHICYSQDCDTLITLENHFLVCVNGVCEGVYAEIPDQYKRLPLHDFGDRLIIPGLSDLHIHAPQFAYRGLGMDMELLDWLHIHAFPEESKYADLAYADRAYESFVNHMRRSETTRACIFATIHGPATELLMEKLDQSGLSTYVGKLNMDRNSPDYYRETDASASLCATREWLKNTVDRWEKTKPMITPRFIPSCTDELLYGLGELRKEFQVPVQSHVSENYSEIAWVKELVPTAKNYGDAYRMFGLFGGDHGCVMSHCVHSDPRELELMRENGVFVAHCPESNMNVASGVAPVDHYLNYGLNVGLATDVAGGSHESMFRAMTHALRSSNLRWRLTDQSVAKLTFARTFFMATKGGGAFFGKVGAFEQGWEFDAVVLDDCNLDHPQPLTIRERLERIVYLGDDRNIHAKYVSGKQLF